MKHFLMIIMITASSLAAKSQRRNDVKKHHPKIKNSNILIVPDQKPVIIERTEDLPVMGNKKESPVTIKNKVPPGKAKKLYGAKSARTFAPGQHKKPAEDKNNKGVNKEK